MLLASLSGMSDLMDAGNYYPKRLITVYLNRDPEQTRNLSEWCIT
jgi:hypothetical protein